MRCAFTDASSTRDGRVVGNCCNAACRPAFIGCERCEPGKTLWRCTNCYHKFSVTIKKRTSQLQKLGTIFQVDALQALMSIDFKALARAGDVRDASQYLELVADGCWRWRVPCACCFTFEVPEVDAQMPAGFAAEDPRVAGAECYDFDARQLTRPDGLIGEPRPVRVEVVRMRPVLTYKQSARAAFRALDPPVHDKYLLRWKPPPPHEDGCASCPTPRCAAPACLRLASSSTSTSHGAGASDGASSSPSPSTRTRSRSAYPFAGSTSSATSSRLTLRR
jgi:hypothetical protein